MTGARAVSGNPADDRGPTWSEAWRHECEVKFVLAMGSPEERRDHLDACERRRGKPAADRLRADVRAAFTARRHALAGG